MTDKKNHFQILASSFRKTISIKVYEDCRVKIMVPKWLSQDEINKVIQKKQNWINKKIEYFKQNKKEELKPKEYTNGEFFYYLGKQYKLIILEAKNNSIERIRDTIFLNKTPKRNTKKTLTKWFFDLAQEVFEERLKLNFEVFSKHFSYPFPTLKIRKMKSRWGSMSNKGTMTLNVNLIHTPVECIDYVVMHELCHLKHQNHGKKFHDLQAKFNANYKETRKRLNDFNAEIKLL